MLVVSLMSCIVVFINYGKQGNGMHGNNLSANFIFNSPPRLHSNESFKFIQFNDVGDGGHTITEKDIVRC